MNRMSSGARFGAMLALTVVVAACGGGAPSPTPVPSTAPTASGAEPTDATAPTQGATGLANLEALDTVEDGVEIEVAWTGPDAVGDYVTIVTAGTTAWTNEGSFYTKDGNPGRLAVPSADGAYELRYVPGQAYVVMVSIPITIT